VVGIPPWDCVNSQKGIQRDNKSCLIMAAKEAYTYLSAHRSELEKLYQNEVRHSLTDQYGCIESQKQPTKKNGYVQASIQISDGQVKVLAHIVAWMTQSDQMPSKGEDISHLCHNSKCLNPNHMTIESKKANNLRKGCQVKFKCPCCEHEAVVCRHNPKCILSKNTA